MKLDNISNETLDKLKELYEDRSGFQVYDERRTISFGKPKEYFLLSYKSSKLEKIEFTFIWIGNNLWQFQFVNPGCLRSASWINPEDLLQQLVEDKFL